MKIVNLLIHIMSLLHNTFIINLVSFLSAIRFFINKYMLSFCKLPCIHDSGTAFERYITRPYPIVASLHNVLCSDLCSGFTNVKTWRVSNPRRVSLLLELISQVYLTATPSRLSLLNLAIHSVVRECIVLLLFWQVNGCS